MKVSVYDILKSQNAVFHDDGLRVFDAIKRAMENGNNEIEVSFENVRVCTTQFLNASFGKLLLELGEDAVKNKVHSESYGSINSFTEKFNLVWENYQEKNKLFIEEAYA